MTRILARSSTADDLVGLLDVDHAGEAVPAPSWRIEPGQRLAVLVDTLPRRAEGDTEEQVPVRRLESARWGLVPAGSPGPDQAPSLAEVPAEQLGARPELLQALVSRRAAIPVSGYYEHHETDDGLRTPSLVGAGDGIVLLAALYGWWRDPARAADDPARWVLTCAVLTRPSAGTVEALAQRMPVVLSPDVVEAWLDPTAEGSPDLLRAVASQAEDVIEQLAMDEVGPGIDRGAPDTAELARPV